VAEDGPNKLFLREIRLGDKTDKLSLGSESFVPLKAFLEKDAWQFHEENIAKTFVYVDSSETGARVYGYVSLTCSAIELEDEQKPTNPQRAANYSAYPAVKIVRLAIDKSKRGQGYGKQLLDWAIAHVTDKIMPNVGCRFLIVDSKKESIGFYEKSGFTLVDSEANKAAVNPMMFIDLHLLNNS
jgi:GNAT superfamily N-acetyltransferase